MSRNFIDYTVIARNTMNGFNQTSIEYEGNYS